MRTGFNQAATTTNPDNSLTVALAAEQGLVDESMTRPETPQS